MKLSLRWRARQHNGLHGSIAMAQQAMEAVLSADSTTVAAKQLAANIRPLLGDLRQELKTRIDPSKSVIK